MKTLKLGRMEAVQRLISAILKDDLGLAEDLLQKGANPNLLIHTSGVMPFHMAVGEIARPELFTLLLLQYRANPNVRSEGDGLTPLHIACMYNNCEVVEMLLHNGGNPYLKDNEGKDAFAYVAETECRRCRCNLQRCWGNLDADEDIVDGDISLEAVDVAEVSSDVDESRDVTVRDVTALYQADDELSLHSNKGYECSKDYRYTQRQSFYTQKVEEALERFDPRRHIFDVTSPDHPRLVDRDACNKTFCSDAVRWLDQTEGEKQPTAVMEKDGGLSASAPHHSASASHHGAAVCNSQDLESPTANIILSPSVWRYRKESLSTSSESFLDTPSPIPRASLADESPECGVQKLSTSEFRQGDSVVEQHDCSTSEHCDPTSECVKPRSDQGDCGSEHCDVSKPVSEFCDHVSEYGPPVPEHCEVISENCEFYTPTVHKDTPTSEDSYHTCASATLEDNAHHEISPAPSSYLPATPDTESPYTASPVSPFNHSCDFTKDFIPENVNPKDLTLSSINSLLPLTYNQKDLSFDSTQPTPYSWNLSHFFKSLTLASKDDENETLKNDSKVEMDLKGSKNHRNEKILHEKSSNKDPTPVPEYYKNEDFNAGICDTAPDLTDDESIYESGVSRGHDFAIRRGGLSVDKDTHHNFKMLKDTLINDSGIFSNSGTSQLFKPPLCSSRNTSQANSQLFDASCSTIHEALCSTVREAVCGTIHEASAQDNGQQITQASDKKKQSSKTLLTKEKALTSDKNNPLTEAALRAHHGALNYKYFDRKAKKGGTGSVHSATGSVHSATGSVHSATGSVQSAGTLASIGSGDTQCSCQSTATVQYVLSDDEADSVILVEKHFPVAHNPCDVHTDTSSDSTILYWQDLPGQEPQCQGGGDADATLRSISNSQLREELEKLGDSPGPITSTTRHVYQQRLLRLRQDPTLAQQNRAQNVYSAELEQALSNKLDVSTLQELEDKMCEPFQNPDPNRYWREGTIKSSFIYLLLDPRVTRNLPNRVKTLGDDEGFKVFVRAVFYVGKGKRARPYSHFKEAIKHDPDKTAGSKVGHILDIWNDGAGVISLHIFQNIMATEAFTREAAIIDAIGIDRLTNIKSGDYYCTASTWPAKKKRLLGVRLLKKAYRIFLSEGERQIRPSDIKP